MSFLSFFSHSDKLKQYQANAPKLDLKTYLNGHIIGAGIIQDWRKNIVKRFDFSGIATWDGDNGRFDEEMTYYNGQKEQRTWLLHKLSDGHYVGTTADVIGQADIRIKGNAMNWHYTMDVNVGNKTYRLHFDDWMFLMHNGIMINTNYFKKFGLTVGSLTMVMHKQDVSE